MHVYVFRRRRWRRICGVDHNHPPHTAPSKDGAQKAPACTAPRKAPGRSTSKAQWLVPGRVRGDSTLSEEGVAGPAAAEATVELRSGGKKVERSIGSNSDDDLQEAIVNKRTGGALQPASANGRERDSADVYAAMARLIDVCPPAWPCWPKSEASRGGAPACRRSQARQALCAGAQVGWRTGARGKHARRIVGKASPAGA